MPTNDTAGRRITELKKVFMVRLDIVTRVKPGKEIEFMQSMDILKSDEETRQGGGRVIIRQEVHEPLRYAIILEWESEQDFESYLDSEGVVFLRGTLLWLCGESQFSISPQSRKLDRLRALHFNLTCPPPYIRGT